MNYNNYRLPVRNIPCLKSDDIHLWTAYLPDNKQDISYYKSILSEDERLKAKNFKFFKDMEQYIISRGILRCLLSIYLEIKPQDIDILYGLWGKPQLAKEFSLHFNLSHSRDYTLYAISSKCEVGLDIEYMDPCFDVNAMTSIILSTTHELDFWQMVNEEQKFKAFFKFWVCKEAFLKASGEGWLNKQQAIPFSVLEMLKEELMEEKSTNKLNLKKNTYFFEPMPGYVGALFAQTPFYPMHYAWSP